MVTDQWWTPDPSPVLCPCVTVLTPHRPPPRYHQTQEEPQGLTLSREEDLSLEY